MKKEVRAENVLADFYCEDCQNDIHDVSVQESIYNGPPMCMTCNQEMTLGIVHVKS